MTGSTRRWAAGARVRLAPAVWVVFGLLACTPAPFTPRAPTNEPAASSPAARGSADDEAGALVSRGNAHAEAGDLAAARRDWRAAAERADEAGDARLATRARLDLARADADAGGDAREIAVQIHEITRALAGLARSDDLARDWLAVGTLWLALGERSPSEREWRPFAEEAFRRSAEVAGRTEHLRTKALALLAQADLAASASSTEAAIDLATRARRVADEAAATDLRAAADARLGLWLGETGHDDEALVTLRRAASELSRWRETRGREALPADPTQSRVVPRNEIAAASATAASRALTALVDRLLRAAGDGDGEAGQALLREARDQVEGQRANELRDWLRNDCVGALEARARPIDEIAGDAAVLHPIVLPDRLVLLLSTGGRLTATRVLVREDELVRDTRELRRLLEKRTTREYLVLAQRLHERLFAPVLPQLEAVAARTVVVVPSGPLWLVPFAALHDGRRFVVERFAVATAPGLRLTQPQILDAASGKALVGGLTKPVGELPALPRVAGESAAIHALRGGRLLLDDAFTMDAVRDAFLHESWPIVHLASHATLAENATASRLQLRDGVLDVDRLAELVAATRFRTRPLDLLSLSACTTAADTRSGLGLAGIAIRSGASSVLGTLWNVQDDAAAELVVAFHRAVQTGGTSRAVALQRAQRDLLSRAETAHPGYWAAFVLVGNWL